MKSMNAEKLIALQEAVAAEWGIGVVEFAETLLLTKYSTYSRWVGPAGSNMPGAIQVACSFIAYALAEGWAIIGLRSSLVRRVR